MNDVKIARITGVFGVACVALTVGRFPLWLVGSPPSVYDGHGFAQHLFAIKNVAFTRILMDQGIYVSMLVFAAVHSFMHWAGFTATGGEIDARPVLDLMYLGLKHFRIPPETLRVLPTLFLDHELRAMHVPTLLLIGEHEVIFEAAAALARARQLIPDVEGELVHGCRHDMCFSQHRLVDARVLGFLKKRGHEPAEKEQRSIA